MGFIIFLGLALIAAWSNALFVGRDALIFFLSGSFDLEVFLVGFEGLFVESIKKKSTL